MSSHIRMSDNLSDSRFYQDQDDDKQ
jgi:hypothetical protein